MNIYLQEFKMKLRSMIIWSVSIAGLVYLFFSIFSTIVDEMETLNSVMANYPPELLAAFGWDQMDLGTVLGFFAFTFSFIQIMIALQAANYGYSLVSVEERELTADFLLAKPIGRAKILTQKLLAALTSLLITDVVLWSVSFLAVSTYAGDRTYDKGILTMVLITALFLQLFFLMFGLVVSLMLKKVPSVISLSMGSVFGMYILAAFGSSFNEDKFDYLTPFKHFEATRIVSTGEFDQAKVIVSLVVILVSIVGSYVLYQRRNIPTV